jgi:hypothetical protein
MAILSRLVVVVFAAFLLSLGLPGFNPPAQAGIFSWFQEIWPKQPTPEDPHLYPEGSLLYDVWTCKGETDIGWIGVTQQFTDHDPYVVVVVRSEFPDEEQLPLILSVELHAPRHNMIIASDRVDLSREQDIGFFYHPEDMSRLGGWGEYKAVICVDGMPRDEITFHLDREEDLLKKKEEEAQKKQVEAALKGSSGSLEAKALLGDPDTNPEENKQVSSNPQDALSNSPQIEVRNPEDWYHTRYDNEQGKIIMFPKKARRTWQENVTRDLRHRIQYYIFL